MMHVRATCRPCRGSGLVAGTRCRICLRDRGHVTFGQRGVPLFWFLPETLLSYARHIQRLTDLQGHATRLGRDIYIVDTFARRQTIAEFIADGRHYQAAPGELWLVHDGHMLSTKQVDVDAWVAEHGSFMATLWRTLPSMYTFEEWTVAPLVAVDSSPATVDKPANDGWKKSNHVPGLSFRSDQPRRAITFRYGRTQETYCLKTGQCIDYNDAPPFPPHISAYVGEKVRGVAAPHAAQPPSPPSAA
jgi:hypothetical protein